MGKERETPLVWYLFSKQDFERALLCLTCEGVRPPLPEGEVSVEGLCHQWTSGSVDTQYGAWGGSGERPYWAWELAFNLDIAGTFFPPGFCGVAWA